MVDKKKGKNEFDDDAFDGDDFADIDFDTAGSDDLDYTDMPSDDADFSDEDFGEDEWQEDQQPAAKKSKNKSYTGGDKKGLSFNTMVIIGAVVVGGGVLVFNVMSKTAEQRAGEPTMFQSIMNMAGVMDGVIFGEQETQPSEEEIALKEQQSMEQGFLNNPEAAQTTDAPQPSATDPNAPPQPSPIAPQENADAGPLTPMPAAEGEIPRGPEQMPVAAPDAATQATQATAQLGVPTEGEGAVPAPVTNEAISPEGSDIAPVTSPQPDVIASATDAPAAPASAEDILKQAMANREQQKQAVQPETGSAPVSAHAESVATPASEPEAPAVIANDNAEAAATAQPTPDTVSVTPAPVATVDTEAVEALEAKIDTLIQRMEKIESDLGSVRDSKSAGNEDMAETIASLKEEISSLRKNAERSEPVAAKSENVSSEDRDVVREAPAKPKAAPKPKKKAPAASATKWELRAAQPGRAWVSRPGERDMQSVEVGQTLAGIGRVTSIGYTNGRWTIYGTQGQINQ